MKSKTKNQTVDPLEIARRIRAAGRPIYIAEDDGPAPSLPSEGLRVRQWGGVIESRAIACAGTAYVINLEITIDLPKFAISAFSLELPWKQEHFTWLEDPVVLDGKWKCYRFGDPHLPEFERSAVLNHHADTRQTHSQGQSLKGCLLGFGYESIPDAHPHGAMIPAFVTVYDRFDRPYRSPVALRAEKFAQAQSA